jgi:hypothetical protein
MKFSLSSLKRFHSPLIHNDSYKQKDIQPKLVIEKNVVSDHMNVSKNIDLEPVKKEDYSRFYIETQLAKFTQQTHSSVVLQMGFCCERPITKLLVTNHTTQLFDCCKDQCPRKLIKTRIGEWS